MSLSNKVAIVTGASSGIGAATAVLFTKEGARVAMVGRKTDKLAAVAKKCEAVGAKPLVIAADVTNEEDAKRIIEDTLKQFKKIDVLVNNAGMAKSTSILADNVLEIFDININTNLRAVVHLTHLAAPHLIKTKGNIVNVSSVAAVRMVGEGMHSYCASKAGMDHFTRNVALELGPHGVRANTVNPGPVKTDMPQNAGYDPQFMAMLNDPVLLPQFLQKGTALGKMSEPEETAEMIAFLACDKSKCVTGANFFSDNGMTLKTA